MTLKNKNSSFKRLIKSFKYAFEGIGHAFKHEQNFIVHSIMAIIVIIFGFIFKLSTLEWVSIIIIMGLVLAFELINTALESLVDLVTKEYKELAKITKDTASAAVLVLAFSSVVIGLIIFLPKVVELF